MKPSVAALAFGVLLSGCSERAPEPLRPTVAPSPAAPAPAPMLTAARDPLATYAYVPAGKRDPFRSEVEPTPTPPPHCDAPLCRYSLDELKLTGIISGMGNPVAVIESPRGKGYSVYRGSKVGRYGVVKQVLRDGVVVLQSWPAGSGPTRQEEIVLRMRAEAPLVLDEP
jgi:type IV pilus assembly protein PilP